MNDRESDNDRRGWKKIAKKEWNFFFFKLAILLKRYLLIFFRVYLGYIEYRAALLALLNNHIKTSLLFLQF